ncbi:MAG: PD-(D/E)XK nuclease family protein [Clostridia bacterium]|nr:PD-(D/E)XK nuclease family protein [Clostridia bacterium]
MEQEITETELKNFALNFDNDIAKPLIKAGFDKHNIFDILNINRQELRHSDFLAFLFDPNKSGDIGRQFLKNFLALIAKEVNSEIDFYTMLYGNIEKIDVSREVFVKDGRIDILIDLEISKDKTEKILIAIENKVDSEEHGNQLANYKTFLFSARYSKHKKIMLLLSPKKSAPKKDNDWNAIDYSLIYRALDMVEMEDTDNTIKTLVNDYKQKIRSEFKMDINDRLRQQAIEIYKNNRKIFDFIIENKPDWREETAKIIHDLLENKGAKAESESQNVYIAFTTNEIKNYKGYYFQIYLDYMSLYFMKDKTHRQCSVLWLFGNKQESVAEAERFKEEYVFDLEKLNEKCNLIIDRIFETNGLIEKCLATLK